MIILLWFCINLWYKCCVIVWLACDYVICHLHTSDNWLVVRGCALMEKVSEDAVTVAWLREIWFVSLVRSG